MPNIEDVAEWIGADEKEILKFDDSYRPVKLETDVFAYEPKESEFINKYVRLYKALNLIKKPLREGHQTLSQTIRWGIAFHHAGLNKSVPTPHFIPYFFTMFPTHAASILSPRMPVNNAFSFPFSVSFATLTEIHNLRLVSTDLLG